MRWTWLSPFLAGGVATLALLILAAAVSSQAHVPTGSVGHYGVPVVMGGAGAWAGAASVDADGFPSVTVTSTSSSLSTASGASAFLATDTPFGRRFGSSARLPYLTADSATGRTPSVTTLRFDDPTPAAGWGFALGDVDADRVAISATDTDGRVLMGAALAETLGWQGAFNYCVATPKPPACTGTGPFTDLPAWDAATATLSGTGSNTFGATGWFAPTAALGSLSLKFSVQTGTPNYQIWLAALSVPVSGHVDGISRTTPDASVDLLRQNGDIVQDDDQPARATVKPNGNFLLPSVTDGEYQLRINPGRHARVEGDSTILIKVDTDNGSLIIPTDAFKVSSLTANAPSITPPTNPTRSVSSTPPDVNPTAEPSIASTGPRTTMLTFIGIALVVAGAATTSLGRRHRPVGPHRSR